MTARRKLALSGAAATGLYLLFHYVPISARHTAEIVPLRLLGRWSLDSGGWLAAYYAAILAGLFALYAHGLRILRRAGDVEPARAPVYGWAAASAAVLVLTPSLLSKDLFDYMAQGRILAVHRANPFAAAAGTLPADAFTRAMGWPQFTSLYGPGWVSACGLLSFVAPEGLTGSALLYKVFLGAAHLVNGALVGALLEGWGRPALPGAYLYLFNPLVLLQTVGQAHNDGFLMTWVFLGLLFVQRRARGDGLSDEILGTACLAVSVLIKYVTAPVLALVLAVRWRGPGLRAGLRRTAILAGAAALVIVLGYLPYAAGMDLLHVLRPYAHGSYQGSALMLLNMAGGRLVFGGDGATPAQAAFMAWAAGAAAILVAVLGVLLLLGTRREEDVPGAALAILLAYLLGATALLRISYGTWLVGLAALAAAGAARRAALIFSASLFALDLYWVVAVRSAAGGGVGAPLHRLQAAAAAVALGAPLLYLLTRFLRRTRGGAPRGGEEVEAW